MPNSPARHLNLAGASNFRDLGGYPTSDGRAVRWRGTDIARDQLARARDGIYSQFEVQRGLPVQMLMRYFHKEESNWRIALERDSISYRLSLRGGAPR